MTITFEIPPSIQRVQSEGADQTALRKVFCTATGALAGNPG